MIFSTSLIAATSIWAGIQIVGILFIGLVIVSHARNSVLKAELNKYGRDN